MRRPQRDRIEHRTLCRKSDILRREWLLLVRKRPAGRFRRPFSIDPPWPRAIDRLAVYVQPFTCTQQSSRFLIRDGAIGTRPDIQQKITVLADNIDEIRNDILRGFEGIARGISPGFIAYRIVRLPGQPPHRVQLPPFQIEHRYTRRK